MSLAPRYARLNAGSQACERSHFNKIMGVIVDEVFDLSAEHHEFAYRFGGDGLVVAEETLAMGCLWVIFVDPYHCIQTELRDSAKVLPPESVKRKYWRF